MLVFPFMSRGANSVSLFEAQQKFILEGVSENQFTGNVRRPAGSDRRDPTWRPFDPAYDPYLRWDSENDRERWRASGVDACLYYWRDDYWLSQSKMG
jgi:hypothetical protein